MKVSYITTYDISDTNAWSGTSYNIWKAIENMGNEIDFIGNIHPGLNLFDKMDYAMKLLFYNKVMNLSLGYYSNDRTHSILKRMALAASKLIKADCDFILSPGTLPIAYLETKKPIFIWGDATFAGLVNYYPDYSNMSALTLKYGNAAEQSALDNCKLAFYSSEWAAKSAIENYNIDAQKVKVVRFGANLERIPDYEEIKEIIAAKQFDTCRLLFIGVDWVRKGGDKAVNLAIELNNRGIKTELTIVGCHPPNTPTFPNFVKVLGFINKYSPKGVLELESLFKQSHFFVLPTVNEAYGLVFCESSAFGLPSLTHDTGGTSSVVTDHINGKLFKVNSKVNEFADYIEYLWSDRNAYLSLCKSSYAEFNKNLNWAVAGRSFMEEVKKVL